MMALSSSQRGPQLINSQKLSKSAIEIETKEIQFCESKGTLDFENSLVSFQKIQ